MSLSQKQKRLPLNTNASLGGSNIKYFIVKDEEGRTVDLTGAIAQFYFYESVLSNYVSATVEIVDSGYVFDNIKGKLKAETGGILSNKSKKEKKNIPSIIAGNRVDFDIEDNNYNNRRDKSLYSLKMPEGMYVTRIRDISTSSLKNYFAIDLVTKEAFNNELTRVSKRYDGKISDSVYKILKEVLGIRDDLIEVEETALEYNFIGNDSKPFNVCTKLASKSVPLPVSSLQTINRRAGYIFFQTRMGMHFVSLANRHLGEKNRTGRIIQNVVRTKEGQKYNFVIKYFVSTSASTVLEDRGDDLILSYTVDNTTDAQKDLALGSYNNRSLFFDFYSMDYKVRDFDIRDDILSPFSPSKRNEAQSVYPQKEDDPRFRSLPVKGISSTPSRLMTHVLNVGTLPKGVSSDAELQNWKENPTEPTYDAAKSMVQSIMQYNNLFREKLNIVVAGDFSMLAGNTIHCSFEAVGGGGSAGNDPEEDKNFTGYYMIANVCHRVTSGDTLTSMDLVPTARII